jgi:lipoprotein-anchoring transpeptidase ErfK/SrfK
VRDYYSILSRAVAGLENNNAQSRALLFERARQMLIQEFQKDPARWTRANAESELSQFDDTTDRIEFEVTTPARTAAPEFTHPDSRRDRFPLPGDGLSKVPTKSRLGRIAVLGTVALVGVIVCGTTFFFLRGDTAGTKRGGGAVATSPNGTGTRVAGSPPFGGDELEPGVDGGSTDAGLPYYLRRQAVYYRTVYSEGMIIVDRSQRFLYLVQPQARAIRYGIGVGGECTVSAGLYRVQSKSQWPEWSPSPALLRRHAFPARLPGGPGNPLGAYAIYLVEDKVPGIHGTNAPKSIGQAPVVGCFRLVNDDIVDLERRVLVGTGVVVMN